MLDDEEIADLRFQQLAAALDERAFGLQRLDQREHAAARPRSRAGRSFSSGSAVIMVPTPVVGEELEQQRALGAARDEMARGRRRR